MLIGLVAEEGGGGGGGGKGDKVNELNKIWRGEKWKKGEEGKNERRETDVREEEMEKEESEEGGAVGHNIRVRKRGQELRKNIAVERKHDEGKWGVDNIFRQERK